MNNRAVQAYMKILCLLLEGEMGVNAIQKQTSSDKKFAEIILKNLRKSKLVQESKDKKHKQKKNQSLTALGVELGEIIRIVEGYNQAVKELDEKIKSFSQIDHMNLDSKKAILRAKGWSSEDIQNYIPYVVDSNRLGYYIKRSLNEFVLYRYTYVIQKYSINNIAKEIIHNIMISILNEYVDGLLRYFAGMKSYVIPHFNTLIELNNQIARYNNRFIGPEITKIERIFTKMLDTPKLTESHSPPWINIKNKIKKEEFLLLMQSELGQRIKQLAIEINIDESALMDLIIHEAIGEENREGATN
jgi:DNA-binding HxlR family transcriptional regulator